MKKGDKVNIYIDPVNETMLEGRATLVKRLMAASTDDRLEGWVVKFDGDASTVKRFVKTNKKD